MLEWGVLSASIQNLEEDDSPDKTWFDEPGEPRWEAWDKPVIVALIPKNVDGESLATFLQNEFNLPSLPQFQESFIKDVDWVKETHKIDQPNKITDLLWVIPTGQSPVDAHATNIFLDPGVSFGSGTHPTTHLCLEWLSNNIKGGESVLDFGCGSGILAIGALNLGAKSARGVDIDPACLNSTRENGKTNGVSIETYLPADLPQDQQFDIIIANILANTLVELLPTFLSKLNPEGHIVVSGFMASQVKKILNAYSNSFTNLMEQTKSDWALISGKLI